MKRALCSIGPWKSDPNFAVVYAQLAQLEAAEYVNGWNEGGTDRLELGMKFAHKALELDSEEARAYTAIAILQLWGRDYQPAEASGPAVYRIGPELLGRLYGARAGAGFFRAA